MNILKAILHYELSHFSALIEVERPTSYLVRHTYCDSTTEKTDAGALLESDAGGPFIANLPHTSKQCDCVILSKSSGIANINPNHHNCARPALKQVLLITENIKSICRPQQPFLGRSNESLSLIHI